MAIHNSTISNFSTKTFRQVVTAVNDAHQTAAPAANATITTANSTICTSSVHSASVKKQTVECVKNGTRVYVGVIDATTGDLTLTT